MNFVVSLLLLLLLLVDINGFKASRPRLIGKAATSSKSESLKLNRFLMFDRNEMQQDVLHLEKVRPTYTIRQADTP